jgi:hypothetical protein
LPAYFTSRFLTGLRDELVLTFTFSKVTLFHIALALLPLLGLTVGINDGLHNHSWWRAGWQGSIGGVTGFFAAYYAPPLLWTILSFFARKGWFVRAGGQNSNEPVMTAAEIHGEN